MSFGAGYHTDDFALVAVDMSHGQWGPVGGKLLATAQGWATLCGDGDGRLGALAARQVRMSYKGSDPEKWAGLLKAAMEQVTGSENVHDASLVVSLFAHMRDGRPTFDMAISDGRYQADAPRRRCHFGPTYGVEQEFLRQQEARVHGVEDPWEAIRRMAAGFKAVSEASDVVSRHVHIAGVKRTPREKSSGGHTKFHLFGDPQELQASSEERLRAKAWDRGTAKRPGLSFDRDHLRDIPDKGGGQIIQRLRADGHLKEDARIEVAGSLFRVTRARQSGKDADAATPSFPAAYGDVPDVAVGAGEGVSYEPSDGSGNFGDTRQHQHMVADNPTNQDFSLVAEIHDRGAQTQVTDSYDTTTADTPLTSQGEAWSLANKDETENGGNGLTDTAVDDTYLNTFSVDLSLTDGGSSNDVTSSSLTVTVATDAWDSDDLSWEEKRTSTFFLSATSGGSDSIQKDQSHEFTDSGLDGALDADDVRVRIKDVTEDCGTQGCSSSVSVSPVDVEYDAADTVAQSMSSDGERYTWIARQEEN